jgi:hypothetical protein
VGAAVGRSSSGSNGQRTRSQKLAGRLNEVETPGLVPPEQPTLKQKLGHRGRRVAAKRQPDSITGNSLRKGSLCAKLVAHLLDLRRLFFEGRGKGCNVLLLLGDGRRLTRRS